MKRAALVMTAVVTAAGALAGCGNGNNPAASSASSTSEPAPAATVPTPPTAAPTTVPAPTTTLAPKPTTTTTVPKSPPTTAAPSGPKYEAGDSGPAVAAIQRRLEALGYWVGDPLGTFGDGTRQAVYALQKVAGIQRDGIVGPLTARALAAGDVPHARPTSGYVVEVDLADDLLMFVRGGKIEWILNVSTGGGYTYTDQGVTATAITPTGRFTVYRQVDGMVTDSLGQLWRPKFFYSGFAIHGDGYVPPYPVSHGCVRVSNEAIDWIWADNLVPIGTAVWVY